MLPKYQPSGAMGTFTPLTLLGLLPLAAVAALVYQLLVSWIPFIYLNFLILVGFGVLLGWATCVALRWTHCRNRLIAAAIGIVTAACGAAVSHAVIYLGSTDPGTPVSQYISERTTTGWSLGRSGSGIPLTGAFVWIVWVIEAGGLLVCGAGGGLAAADTPYCEKCGKYADKKESSFSITSVSEGSVATVEKAETVRELVNVESGGGNVTDVLTYALHGCPSCESMNTLTIKFDTVKMNGKKEETSSRKLHEAVLLTDGEAQAFKARAGAALQTF